MNKSSFLLIVLIAGLAMAQQRPATRPQQAARTNEVPSASGFFYGSMFSDYTFVLQEPQTANPASGTSGRNEFVIRRALLGYQYSFTKDVAAVIEYDAAGGGLYEAFANVNNLVSLVDLRLGMMQNSSAETIEKIWEYRSLDPSVLERNGLLNEFDKGMIVTARTNPQGTSYARLGAHNGTVGAGGVEDKLKKLSLTVGNWFDRMSVAEVYVDYENVGFGRSVINAKLFYGMKTPKFAFGGEGFYRMNRKFAGTTDITPVGASVYGWFEMMKSVRGVVRIDVMDNDFNNSNIGYREIYVNAGLDYSPVPDMHVIPNIGYTKQMKKGNTVVNVDAMIVRLTAAVAFPSLK